MPAHKKATDDQVTESYQRTNSVWDTAAEFGMCGQSVHERLVKLGKIVPMNVFTDADRGRISAEYEKHANSGTLDELASDMGRTRQFICRQAKAMGLTDRTRSKSYLAESMSVRTKAWIAENGHPRGALGMVHKPASKAAMSAFHLANFEAMTKAEKTARTVASMRGRLAKNDGKLANIGGKKTWKAAWRKIGDRKIYCRSSWEANYARVLESMRGDGLISSWEHEPETFWLSETATYLPDFRVTALDGSVTYHEVKGWMCDRSKAKLAMMADKHPQETVIVIDGPVYRALRAEHQFSMEGWE